MIYAIWHQAYDYAGFELVEGPDGLDIEALSKEFFAIPIDERFEKWAPKEAHPFQVHHCTSLVNWLIDKKACKKVEVRYIEC